MGYKLQHFPLGSGGLCYPLSFHYMIFGLLLIKLLHKKNSIEHIWRRGYREGLVATESLLALKKGIRSFNFKSFKSPSKSM